MEERTLTVAVKDCGVGIADVKQAMEPMFTTDPEGERSGMGFSFMEAFMDQMCIRDREEQSTETIKEAVRAIRGVRSSMNVPPSKKATV